MTNPTDASNEAKRGAEAKRPGDLMNRDRGIDLRRALHRDLGSIITGGLTAALMLTAIGVAVARAQAPAPTTPDPTPVIDFPGQYAPRPVDEKFGINTKVCQRAGVTEKIACYEFVTNDWPRLGRYAAANAALAAPKTGERRVVFFGASSTDNWSKKGYGPFFPGKPYVNRGIGGATSAQMLIRFRPDVVALRPKAVVILAGTNDVSGNTGPSTPAMIEDNLASMIEIAQANKIAVVVASLLPTTDDKRGKDGAPIVRSVDRPPAVIKEINEWMAAQARKKRVVFLDYTRTLADAEGKLRAELTDDGLHPNAAGYAVMAPLAEKAIAAALGR